MATYREGFIKLTFGGQLAAGQDEWNCGINLAAENDALIPIGGVDLERAFDLYVEEMKDDIVTIFSSYVSATVMKIPAGATLDYVKLALIGEDGKYVKEAAVFEVVDVTGGASNAYIPQVSLVMTLQSEKFRDPGKYNRFYLPTIVPISNNGYRPTGTDLMAERTAELLSVLTREMSPFNNAVRVYPAAVSSSDKIEEAYREIKYVKVGNVFDTQRRRRNKIGEIYETVIVPENVPVPTP